MHRSPGLWAAAIVEGCKKCILMSVVDHESNPVGERPFEGVVVNNSIFSYGEVDTISWLQIEDIVLIDLTF